mgnify:CR=1 FL=1
MTPHRILVVGSAHLDIMAKASHPDAVIDRIGNVSIEVGGTGCNIAVNLAHMDCHPYFVSAMNRSAYTEIVKSFLKDNKVEMHIREDAALPVAAFSAHIDYQGELLSAITAAPVETYEFSQGFFSDIIKKGMAAMVLECNLSAATLNAAVSAANGLGVPVYIAAVSEPKSLRLADIHGDFAVCFINRNEIRYLKEHRLKEAVDFEDMSALLGASMVITCGEAGAILVDGNQSYAINPPAIDPSGGNLLGMGDMFMSATIKYHLVNGQSLHQAARNAVVFTRELAKRGNCNLGRGAAVESLIAAYNQNANTDALTGIGNRRATEAALEEATQESLLTNLPMSVILLDLDRFKMINDEYGHATGDKVLSEVADVIFRNSRGTDAVGRWGGEEFVVVMPNASLEDAVEVAERIRHSVATMRKPTVRTTLSAGVSVARPGEPFKDVMMRADLALYRAKATGRNRICTENDTRESEKQTAAN